MLRTPPDAVWSSHMPLCTVEPLSVEGRPADFGSPSSGTKDASST